MMRITEIVKHLLIVNFIVFFGIQVLLQAHIDVRPWFTLFTPDTGYFKPVQLLTNMFTHYEFYHILFNMLVLFFLGPLVESALGPKRFLLLYLVAGIAGGTGQMLLSSNASIVGASGATMGVLAAFAGMFPNLRLMLLFPPIPVKAKYLAIALIAIDLFSGMTGTRTGIGHFAHVFGAFVGIGLVIYWRKLNLR